MVRLTKFNGMVSIHDFKAEGQYGGGLVSFEGWDTNMGPDAILGNVSIYGGTYNCGAVSNYCDFVVLKSGGERTASVLIHPVNLFNVRYLIRDDFAGRNVKPYTQLWSGLDQTTCRLPVQYESCLDLPYRSRLVVGGTALAYLEPTTTNQLGWYRVMIPMVSHLGGRLVISSFYESSELSVDVNVGASGAGSRITVERPTLDSGTSPCVTEARAGVYYSDGYHGFLDIHVARIISDQYPIHSRITLAHPIEGHEEPGSGRWQLLTPTAPLTSFLPDGASLISCVTNSLVR